MFVKQAPSLARMAKPRTATETIAERLRDIRQRRGWSVRKLAEECAAYGVESLTQASITNIERGLASADEGKRGGRTVTADELIALSYVLGVRPIDLMVPHDAEEMQIAPGVAVHPYVAATWIRGDELNSPSLWGPLIRQDEFAQPEQWWAYQNFDYNFRRLAETREKLQDRRSSGENLSALETAYSSWLLNVAMILQTAARTGVRLPAIPRWAFDDLVAADRRGDLFEPEFQGPRSVPTRTGQRVRLPDGLAVQSDDQDGGKGTSI